ncbi:erythrocyte membrane protein 1, PfEMP1, putative [Plasmodium sp.]|nr:erythrocyte membrane protein 1, PfEMP1, putative [Plasmodium sp.]
MGPQHAGHTNKTAKEVLEEYGEQIQQEAKRSALPYNEDLYGLLSKVEFSNGDRVGNNNACLLNYTKDTNVTSGRGKENPCYGRQGVRFSDTNGAECYWRRIKGSDRNTGSCAPFRRLHMCDRNLEEIYPHKIQTTHNLLVDVLLAAKHEGEMITKKLKEYDEGDYNSRICTELARSFADIGDIIRGKDLFLGHNQRKKNLEKSLETMFVNIRNNNTKKLGQLTTEQLREYWWALNRLQVWKALTCKTEEHDKYFRQNDSDGKPCSVNKCKCTNGDPPTNLDYVPQYLRWFQEWSEEFCRKKKKNIEIVKKFCRNDKDKLYCSLNAHDCTETIWKIGKLVVSNDCTKCAVACRLYESWIGNQKQEFKKQKMKYVKEILNYSKKEPSRINNNYKGYDKQFYEKFKNGYSSVDKYLKLLNNEYECKRMNDKKGKIDFTNPDDDNGTFSRSQYCQPCPDCGVECDGNECKPRQKDDKKCQKEINKVRDKHPKTTNIEFLFNDKEREDIMLKLNPFCYSTRSSSNYNGIEKWKCSHYEDNDNECEMQNNFSNVQGHPKIMTFVDFFQFWVTDLLNDAIQWRKEISKCLTKSSLTKCINRCNRHCKCFTKWVNQKQKEWKQIKEHYKYETNFEEFDPYDILEYILEEGFLDDIKKAYGNDEAIERIEKVKKDHASNKQENVANEKYAIDVLLDHEKEDAQKCAGTHNDNNCENITGGRSLPDDHEEEEDEVREVNNPCAKPNHGNTKHPAILNQVAQAIQEDAHAEASKRGLHKLKGNALEGKYFGSGKEHKLKNICSITEDHSNCTNRSKKPCDGKDGKSDMFDITEGWKNGNFVNKTHTDTYMPPRRQHFCTSNLEYLETKDSPLCGNNSSVKVINDSFLGDVLLSAKSEAKFIIDKYGNAPDGFKDEGTICRAVRYSFADLGDIIRGRDIWDEDKGEQTTQQKLEEIFDTILNKNPEMKEKYKNIEDKKHIHFREDWWEANRKDIWRAMQCELKNLKKSDGDCYYNSANIVPVDDYIPQRLRWLTEWAEWYCKIQSQEYKTLQDECSKCKARNQQCTQNDGDCKRCKPACDLYGEKIKKWRKQWNEMKVKYLTLYLQAQTTNASALPSIYGDLKDQQVVDFFKELQKETDDTTSIPNVVPSTPYGSASGYVHQEAPYVECKIQDQFCQKKHGETLTSGTKEDEEYTFREKPKDHDVECSCDKPQEKQDDVCKFVEDHFKLRNVQSGEINGCNKKGNNKWDCDQGSMNSENNGACMPPRRQTLCISNLTFKGETEEENKLREAFIKCSAKETHFLWEKYKKNKNEADTQLKSGTIPEDFKRMMYYTFCDYRDFCLGTDISAKKNSTSIVKDNIDNFFKKKNKPDPKTFWNKNASDIWRAMICALQSEKVKNNDTYKYDNLTPSLEKFAERHQFLRWYIEWSDEFCRERQKKENEVNSNCKNNYEGCENKKSGNCFKSCVAYKNYINSKISEYNTQKKKFEADRGKDLPGYHGYAGKEAPEYLKKECLAASCSCMEKVKDTSNYWDKPFEYFQNSELQKKCECEPPPKPACEIVDDLFKDTESLQEACSLKYGPKAPTGWKCVPTTSGDQKATTTSSSGATCIPPRRRKLYVTPLTKWANSSGNTQARALLDTDEASPSGEKLRTAFIESAAVETFFLWDRYKKLNAPRVNGPLGDYGSSGYSGASLFSTSSVSGDMQAVTSPVGAAGVPHIPSGLSARDQVQSIPLGAPGAPGVGVAPEVGVAPGVGVPAAGIPVIPGAGLGGIPPQAQLPTLPQSQLTGGRELLPLKPLDGSSLSSGDDNNPETLLQNGKIPPDFLRLMFYTLADYRDILFSGDKDKKNGYSDIVSGDKEMKEKEENIKEKIKTFFQQSGTPSHTPVKTSGQKSENPESWWKTNGQHIWNGMICALTYKDSEQKGAEGKPEKIQEVYEKFFGKDGESKDRNPLPQPVIPGTYQSTYKYETVELKEEDDQSGAKPTIQNPTSGEKTTLDSFIKRPPYFRYLEEWGQNFCKERKKRLKEVKDNCMDESGTKKKCSGDGEDCKTIFRQKYDILPSLECPSCAKPCGLYKRWIIRKKTEFEEQQKAYSKQKNVYDEQKKGVGRNNDDNEFYKRLKTYAGVADFLKTLGSCSKNDDNDNGKDNVEDEIDFNHPDKTFKEAHSCAPCSEFKVKCKQKLCNNDAGIGCKSKDSITATDIKNGGNSVEDIDMLVSDNSGNGFEGDIDECILGDCQGAGIFKGIRIDEWTCGNVCGYNVCKPKNVNGEKVNGNQIIFIRAFFKRWLEYFVQDYNKIKQKLKPCMKKGEGSPCIKDYDKTYNCVAEWIKLKKSEWEKIKEHYKKHNPHDDIKTSVKNFFGDVQPQSDVKKATGHKEVIDFENSCHCNGPDNSQKNDAERRDVVVCLLDKLEKEAKRCADNLPTCDNSSLSGETSPQNGDDDLFEEEDNENQVGNTAPEICKDVIKEQPKQEDEDDCKTDLPQPDVKEEEEEKEEEKDKGDEEEEAASVPPGPPPSTPAAPKGEKKVVKPKSKPKKRQLPPSILPEMVSISAFPLSVGIAFAAFTYFVLKKKTKPSVGNLFQILQIPKGNYDIPTLKSSNRYIPYASDRYKGKTYIYMEGDSSGDEKYAFMSDTTDVTSSESEFEELDVNDIYVPGSPKYKTLIEVVLEPSKRDIPSDDIPNNDTPMNKFTDEEWNQLKHDFISNMLPNQPNDVPNDYSSVDIPLNTQQNTLYFDNNQEKPFITSIHDRNLYSGEEYSYNVNMVNNDDIPISGTKDTYSGIDLINDSLNNNNVDIYDEVLKRKENELFGTNHPKHTTGTHNVTKSSNSDPVDNQLDLFHTWLDRHRDMCEQWNNKEELLDKLKEEWNKDNNNGDIHTSDSNKTLNTDVSIQIHMDNPKPTNEFTNMDTILEDLEKYNDPYYDVQDDIYYDVNDHDTSTVDTNAMDVPSKVQIEMDVNTKLVKEKYPIADVWDI